MPNFYSKMRKIFKVIFEDDTLEDKKQETKDISLEETSRSIKTYKSDTDTFCVMRDLSPAEYDEIEAQEEESGNGINEEDYWWYFEGHPEEEVAVFDEIDNEEIVRELNRRIENDEFPVIEIPSNVMQTMQLLNNPEFSYGEVSNLINHSPAMAGEFIRVLNSSLYNRGMAVSDLKVALPRLGKENIKAMLYMYSSKMSFANDPLFNDLAVKIIDHSYATGLIAGYLSQRYYPDPDGAFLAGLLHNIGKLGILKAVSEIYDLPKSSEREFSEEAFDKVFPGLYEKAGKFLAENWKVDSTVVCAIEHHNDFFDVPFEEDDQLAMHLCELINLSSTMARILGRGRCIGKVNVFELPSTIDLAIEQNMATIQFLEDVPKVLSYKSEEL